MAVLIVDLDGTKFPVIGFNPTESLPDQPPSVLIGSASEVSAPGIYRTPCRDFSGPAGQEFWDSDLPKQGYRSGGLMGDSGYLVLPTGPEDAETSTADTVPAICPSNVGLSYAPADGSDPRQILPMGNTIWRSDAGTIGFANEGAGNPVATITGATQIAAIVALYKATAARLWAAGAAAAADFYLRYSDDGGATWPTHGTFQGEALATVRKRQGFGETYWVLVGKRTGEVYGFNTASQTVTFCEATGGGRIVFLTAEYTSRSIWFLKGGRLAELNWESMRGTTNAASVDYYPGLEGLTCGCLLGSDPVVCDGSPGGIWRVTDEDIQWLGLPPNLALQFTKIVYLAADKGDIIALAEDAAGATTLLVCTVPGQSAGAKQGTRQTIAQKTGFVPTTPYPNAWESWQPILTVAQKPYALHIGRLGESGKGYVSACFLMCYDATTSYIYPFYMPRGGVRPPGGRYASGTYHRVMPTFAPMPSETGMLFGVEIGYDLPEAGTGDEAIQASYSLNNCSTWAEFSAAGINTVARSSATLLHATPIAFRVIDLRISLTRGATVTKTAMILWFTPIWFKRRGLRWRWEMAIDVEDWAKNYGAYDHLLAALDTLYGKTTPITMTIGNLVTTYQVMIERIIPDLSQAERPDILGSLRLILQETP